MSTEQTKTYQPKKQGDPDETVANAGGPSPVADAAQQWADTSRRAHEACVKGADAERELTNRKNTSAQ